MLSISASIGTSPARVKAKTGLQGLFPATDAHGQANGLPRVTNHAGRERTRPCAKRGGVVPFGYG
jgi:hypothetical protein